MSSDKVAKQSTSPLANNEPHPPDRTQAVIVKLSSPEESTEEEDTENIEIDKSDERDTEMKGTTPNLLAKHESSKTLSNSREDTESSPLSEVRSSEDIEDMAADLATTTLKKGNRVNRKTKPFVNFSKDPRAVPTNSISNARKRRLGISLHPPPAKRTYTTPYLGLPFNTIKSINMPPRIGLVAGQNPPTPIDGTYPFGDTEDHQSSMLIHFLDELEYSYGEATGLYNNAFPNDQITDEAIRRRHLRCLERLLKRYGAKPIEQIGPVGKKILRRGKPRATRLGRVVREGDASGDAATSVDGGSTSSSAGAATSSNHAAAPHRRTLHYTTTIEALQEKRNMKKHHFETICIVVWRDTDAMEFKAIRERLEDKNNWSIGTKRVKELYYANRDMVHGARMEDLYSEEDQDGGEAGSEVAAGEDEEVEGRE